MLLASLLENSEYGPVAFRTDWRGADGIFSAAASGSLAEAAWCISNEACGFAAAASGSDVFATGNGDKESTGAGAGGGVRFLVSLRKMLGLVIEELAVTEEELEVVVVVVGGAEEGTFDIFLLNFSMLVVSIE